MTTVYEEEDREENGEEEDKDKEKPEPCDDKCAPGNDKEIIFNKKSCLAADPKLMWDYQQSLLKVDGRLAAAGYISSGKQVEGAYMAPLALGLGSFNFTPPSGYGGIVYRGGSIFYYWNDESNTWETIDLAPAEDVINVEHNGHLVWTGPTLNFIDSVSVTWDMMPNGTLGIEAFGTGGGHWIADVDAAGHCIKNLGCIQGAPGFYISNISNIIGAPNFSINNLSYINNIPIGDFVTNPMTKDLDAGGFCINNLGCINDIPISDYLTNVWNQTVNANENNLINVNDLYVDGEFYYHNKTLEQWLADSNFWTLNADGSITRNSDVHINGTSDTPLTVSTSDPTNYLYLNATDGAAGWVAFGAEINNQYVGELGFSTNTAELWSDNYLAFRVYGPDNTCSPGSGYIYFPGRVGVGIVCPQYFVDVVSSDTYVMRVKSTSNFCGLIIDHGVSSGAQSIISFRSMGNETAVIEYDADEDNLIFWTGSRDAYNSKLCCDTNSRVGIMNTSPAYRLDVNGDIHASGCVYIGYTPISLCEDGSGNLVISSPIVTPKVYTCDIQCTSGDLILEGNVTITGNLTVQGTGGGGSGSSPRGNTIVDQFTLPLPNTVVGEGVNMAREFYIGEDGWGPWTFVISQNGGNWVPANFPAANGQPLGHGWYVVWYRQTSPGDPTFPATDFAIGSVVWYGTCPQGSVTWVDKSF